MPSLFDGLTGVFDAVLGSSVVWTPASGAPTQIVGLFRETPIRVPDEDGSEFLLIEPTLRVRQPAATAITRGDTIAPGNGKTYRVGARHPSGSPAADAYVVFQLELLP